MKVPAIIMPYIPMATSRWTHATTWLPVLKVVNPRIIWTTISRTNPIESPWSGLNGGFNL
jgi:hypothetical protein